MKFLAIDFGTSNCVASYSENGKVFFVPLEGNKSLLPSVLYVNRRQFAIPEVTHTDFNKAMAEARRSERDRVREHEHEILVSMKTFDERNAPQRPKRPPLPQKKDYTDDSEYEKAVERHSVYIEEYSNDLQDYEKKYKEFTKEREIFEEKIRDVVRPPMNEKQLEEIVKRNLRIEARRKQEAQYRSQTIFQAFDGNSQVFFGNEALHQYALDPDGGFFFRSPKSFLGSDIGWLYAEDFLKVIETLLAYIKATSENFSGHTFDGVVLGRPVNYQGTLGEEGNQQAMNLMSQAAKKVGFSDVRFFLEPVAAAMTLDDREIYGVENFLVVDIGGGTTDCAFLKNIEGKNPRFEVLSFSGDRVGGCDIDQSIAWRFFMPHLGKGSKLRSGLPLPQSLLHDAISTRNIPAQQNFQSAEAEWQLEKYKEGSVEPHKLLRLMKLRRLKLQHLLLLSAEELKIAHSEKESVIWNLEFLEEGLTTETVSEDLSDASSIQVSAFSSLALQAIERGKVTPKVIFVTGGVMRSEAIFRALRETFPRDVDLRVIDLFLSVGIGLGRIAGDFEKVNAEQLFSKYQRQGYAFSANSHAQI